MNPSNTENREQTFDEKLDAIIWELTDSSGWDLIGITQAQADALSEQLQSERAEAKQAIKTLYKQERLHHLSTKIRLDEQNKKVEAFENMLNAFGFNPQKEES